MLTSRLLSPRLRLALPRLRLALPRLRRAFPSLRLTRSNSRSRSRSNFERPNLPNLCWPKGPKSLRRPSPSNLVRPNLPSLCSSNLRRPSPSNLVRPKFDLFHAAPAPFPRQAGPYRICPFLLRTPPYFSLFAIPIFLHFFA